MPHILPFALFEASKTSGIEPLTKIQQQFLNRYTKGIWTWNPETGLVDIKGNFDFSRKRGKDFCGVRFGLVSGNFWCSSNQLTSLEGSPKEVVADFACANNRLTSLEGAPEEVGGDFYCHENQLTSLEGAPKEVGGDFFCWNNKLTSLVGSPGKVEGNFDCSSNKLASLVGAPEKIGGDFDCDSFYLENWSMKGFLDLLAGKGEIKDLDATKRLIFSLLDGIQPEEIYKNDNANEILSRIRKEQPQLWNRIKDLSSRSSLSADMGDLFF